MDETVLRGDGKGLVVLVPVGTEAGVAAGGKGVRELVLVVLGSRCRVEEDLVGVADGNEPFAVRRDGAVVHGRVEPDCLVRLGDEVT